jgi:hypothetical protein
MRVAHEAPLSIINKVRNVTDYDYALVHLFEESDEYYDFFKDSVARGRYVILDNSIFELGTAFDADKFAEYVKELNPSAYIVPDVLEDCEGTIKNFDAWIKKYKDLPGKKIGVVQGKDWNELNHCYKYMNMHADIIAISFDYSWYESEFPNEQSKYHSWMKGRQHLLGMMEEAGTINKSKPHHLLGAGLPQEFAYYKNWQWIDTIDTSNPVVHGMLGIKYERQPQYDIYGLDDKASTKLFTMIDKEVANEPDIFYNIKMFKHNIEVR